MHSNGKISNGGGGGGGGGGRVLVLAGVVVVVVIVIMIDAVALLMEITETIVYTMKRTVTSHSKDLIL